MKKKEIEYDVLFEDIVYILEIENQEIEKEFLKEWIHLKGIKKVYIDSLDIIRSAYGLKRMKFLEGQIKMKRGKGDG